MGAQGKPYVRAKNRYRQVRLTYTEEASGRLSVSIYVKPLNEGWAESQCLYRFSVEGTEPAPHLEDVALRLMQCLERAFPRVQHEVE